ncbi:hypothetical protein ASC77_14220 [Nocardioides sp. Root1257]|nr:hypothetical protein ASC77_14220 [Nocardioides sp. Root1257]
MCGIGGWEERQKAEEAGGLREGEEGQEVTSDRPRDAERVEQVGVATGRQLGALRSEGAQPDRR